MAVTVRTTVNDGLAHVVLDHPPLNILTRHLLSELREALATLAAQPALRVLVVRAEGRNFSAGADVGEHLPPHHAALVQDLLDTVSALDGFPVPVLVAVQGRCLGGAFELVLAADIVLAAKDAVLGQPEIRLGVVPPAACALLPHRCARGVASDLLFTGDPLTAAAAQRAGLVARVTPAGELEAETAMLARRIARHSAAALRAAKRSLRLGTRLRDALALGAAGKLYVDELMPTHDAVEGLQAFLEKREAVWTHA